MMRISNTGITEEIAKDLDHIISQEIQSTIPIRDLILSNRLPSINVPWTDWLIYSTLNKWGEKTVVATTSNQFKAAVPLIAPVGEMDISAFTGLIPNQESNSIKIDNLDDIDRLLENILDDDLWEEDI